MNYNPTFSYLTESFQESTKNTYPIIKAWYGDEKKLFMSKGVDTTEKIYGLIKDNKLSIDINNNLFGDPAPGIKKILVIQYYNSNKKIVDIKKYERERLSIDDFDVLPTAEEIMYKSDLENIKSNKSIDDVEDNKIINLIKDKLNNIGHNRKHKFSKNINLYHKNKDILQQLYNNNHKSELLLDKQGKEVNYNNIQLLGKKNDIITLKRQIEISQNQTIRRNNKLFILKTMFVYFLILIIPILLIKNNNISNTVGIISISVITLLFLGIILLNFYRNRNINSINYDVRDWDKPNIKSLSEEK